MRFSFYAEAIVLGKIGFVKIALSNTSRPNHIAEPKPSDDPCAED